MNKIKVKIFKYFLGNNLKIFTPKIIPIPVIIENASIMPINTIIGEQSFAAKIIVVICVLSPNSIRETIKNVLKKDIF
ncbi:MAG: hypothetical protein QXF09_04930 [Nitrososphaerota archaeon]